MVIFSCEFLGYQFERTSYEVSEGDDSLELMVLRRGFSGDDRDAVVIFRIRSMDRNAEQEMQTYIAEIFDLDTTNVGIRETAASMIFSATATAAGRHEVFPMQLNLHVNDMIFLSKSSNYISWYMSHQECFSRLSQPLV